MKDKGNDKAGNGLAEKRIKQLEDGIEFIKNWADAGFGDENEHDVLSAIWNKAKALEEK